MADNKLRKSLNLTTYPRIRVMWLLAISESKTPTQKWTFRVGRIHRSQRDRYFFSRRLKRAPVTYSCCRRVPFCIPVVRQLITGEMFILSVNSAIWITVMYSYDCGSRIAFLLQQQHAVAYRCSNRIRHQTNNLCVHVIVKNVPFVAKHA